MKPYQLAVAVVLLTLLMSSCAAFKEIKGRDYRESAFLNFQEGLRFLKEENYEVAEKYFRLVKTKYQFSDYAKSSDLLAADTKFRRELYEEAINSYKNFQRDYPDHPCIPYTQYRIGESYFEQMVDDWWFMPPAYERDQKETEMALSEYERLIRLEKARDYYYPPDYKADAITLCMNRDYKQVKSYLYQAKMKSRYSLRRLIDRELYVADYYLKRDKPCGAVTRLESAVKRWPQVREERDVMVILAEAYEKAGNVKQSLETWEEIQLLDQAHQQAGDEATEQVQRLGLRLKDLERDPDRAFRRPKTICEARSLP